MRGINKAIIVGTLGADPEIRYLPSGDPVANMRLATNEEWKDRQTGEKQQRTDWHSVVIFGKLADVVGKYLSKGSRVYVEGKLQTRKWQDQNGQDRYSTEIKVDVTGRLEMLGGGQQEQGGGQQNRQGQQQGGGYGQGGQQGQQGQRGQQGQQGQQQRNDGPPPNPGSFNDFDDEIPFN